MSSPASSESSSSSPLQMLSNPEIRSSVSSPGLRGRRNQSGAFITNVEKHGGPRRRHRRTGSRSASRTRPSSPTSSVVSDVSSISGKSITVVLKLGTSSICDADTHLPLLANLSMIVETVIRLRHLGHRVILVSSGAVGIGLRRLGIPARPSELALVQAIAAVGQGRLMALWDDLFGQLGQPIAQILLTRSDLSQRTQYLNACNTFEALLEMGVVPIVNENDTVSVGEIRFGDNDTLSAITAGMVHADFLFLLTDVDCLYTDNPRRNPNAKPITTVTDIGALREIVDVSSSGSSVGTGGMATKLIAAELATAAGVTTIVTHSANPGKIVDIVEYFSNPDVSPEAPAPNNVLCTRFVAMSRPMIDRKWWILHGMRCAGTIYLDAGAVVAVAKYKKSLFAAGVIGVSGNFSANQSVRIVYEVEKEEVSANDLELDNAKKRIMSAIPENKEVIEIGHGLVNYTSSEINRIKGHHSSEFHNILGYCDSDNVVNRGNLVITVPEHIIDDIFVTRVSKNKIRAEQRAPVPVTPA